MKQLISVVLLSLVMLSSCSERSNPVAPMDSNATFYLGKIGTQRIYNQIVKYFVPGTDSPYVTVPDSLSRTPSETLNELRQGIVSHAQVVQNVDSIQREYYDYWKLPGSFSDYKELEGWSMVTDLIGELQAASQGTTYSPKRQGFHWGKYLEKSDSIINVLNPYPNGLYLLKPLEVGLSWIQQQWQYTDKSGAIRSHNIAERVITDTTITIQAGTFHAYKIEISYNWPDIYYSMVVGYNYFVPNVGDVLEERDHIESIITFYGGDSSSTVVTVRNVSRLELAAYSIVE